jgi:GntR family transcriptional regulator
MGMFVCEGAVEKLIESERKAFMQNEWPATLARAKRLGVDIQDLLKVTEKGGGNG